MKRRDFIAGLGGTAAAWPLAARAQQRTTMPLVGFINSASAGGYGYAVDAFRHGLKEIGYVEGQNVAVEYRWADGQYDRVPVMALELVSRQPTVIVANTPGVLAIKAAVTTIPIVFTTASDPVQIGLVSSLSRPGGNVTGATIMHVELMPKRLEMAREMLPGATLIGVLVNPTNPETEALLKDLHVAAQTLGLRIHVLNASTERDFDMVFANLVQLRASALTMAPDGFLLSRSEQLAALAVRHAIPTIFQDRAFVAAGGLMSYGGSTADAYRLAGVYTGRILKGEKPADLPVQQVTRIELVINLKAAKALGLTFPLTLLGRADEVIE